MANKPIFAVILTLVGIMTLCVLVTKPIANHALAQHLLHFAATTPAPCSLTVSADRSSGSLAVTESIGSTISGKLTCGGTGLGAATIDLPVCVIATPNGILYSLSFPIEFACIAVS